MNRAKIFKQAFDNRAPQEIVADATKERGYREGFTPEQFLARQTLKMQEELGELARLMTDYNDEENTDYRIADAAYYAKISFDDLEFWKSADVSICKDTSFDELRGELADMQVVLFNMAQIVSEITGEPFDVISAAVEK